MKMKGNISPAIGILFILSVLIPGIVLGVIGLQATDKEEAYIEKRFQTTMLAEVMHAISLINDELDKINLELKALFENTGNETDAVKKNALAAVPFMVSNEFRIVRPDPNLALSEAENEFMVRNKNFLLNQIKVPVYEDLALAYKDIIIEQQQKNDVLSKTIINDNDNTQNNINADEWNSREEISNQSAKMRFEQDEDVRGRIYDQAISEGKKISYRNVLQYEKNKKEEKNLESAYYLKNQSFSEIISGKSSGFIPRIIDGRLTMMFWTKTAEGMIAGCMVDGRILKDRLLNRLPEIITDVRILTVLDETGSPLIFPGQTQGRNMRIPFVSREIGKDLPRWEAAAYLIDPGFILKQARSITLIMWIFIFMLIISITSGGIIILKSFYSGILLAQQKTTFVSNVTHELKTPLTSIRLFAEMLKEGRQPDREKQKKYLDLMVSETRRLSRLINNVLDFSNLSEKKKKYTMEKTDIAALCRKIFEEQKLKLSEKGFAFEFSSPVQQIIILADAESIEQALLNIIFNAEKYSADKKEITIELAVSDECARIAVKDRGIGIPAKHAKKIFKEFYRVDDSLTSRVRGSGLGLSIAKKIVEAHRGTICYKPHQGGGSCFIISLPILKSGNI
jgi:signal transduction histidine kinase